MMPRKGKLKCFTVTWRIENFSFYSLTENKDLSSPPWNTETTQESERWKLVVSNKESNICFRLINLKGDDNSGKYEITFLTSNGEILLKSLSTNHCIPWIAKAKILDDKGVSVLPQDSLTISCRILNQTVLPGICRLCTALQKIKCIWEIKDFEDNSFYLSIPGSPHDEANILLSMFFSDYDTKGTFNVQVELLPNMSGWSALIDCHINIRDGLGKVISVVRGSQSWSYEIKVKSEASTKLLLELESLIALKLTFQQNPTSSVGDDIVFFPKEGARNVATLNTEKKSFKVHKSILSGSSSVFRDMVADDGGLTDDRWWVVLAIDDVDSLTLERMLVFMYTGSLETMDLLDEVTDLYNAADKYAIHALKQKCVDILKAVSTT